MRDLRSSVSEAQRRRYEQGCCRRIVALDVRLVSLSTTSKNGADITTAAPGADCKTGSLSIRYIPHDRIWAPRYVLGERSIIVRNMVPKHGIERYLKCSTVLFSLSNVNYFICYALIRRNQPRRQYPYKIILAFLH